MASEYTILEEELTQLKTTLKRDLHMKRIQSLRKKQKHLLKNIVQRRQIEYLTKHLAEIEPTATKLYCPQFVLKDQEIKGYLVYLLKMKDYFAREVATKEEMLKQKESQTKMLTRKYCSIINENAKLNKLIPRKSPEFIRLENMSNRMNQINKRICTVRQENKEIMENINNMRDFQGQFKLFEKDFRRKISHYKDKAQELLDKAVTAYEEKDEFMNKGKMFKERRDQDLRKIAINENALNLCLHRFEKNESFVNLQDTERTDMRVFETRQMVEKGITGLESSMEEMQNLQTSIYHAADEESPEKMEANFKLAANKIDMMFSILDELLKEINALEEAINILKEKTKTLAINMMSNDEQLKKSIEIKQEEAQKKLEEADEATKCQEDARKDIGSLLNSVTYLYSKCFPEDTGILKEKPVSVSNIFDYLQNMEKQLLDYLICLEYIRMKEEELKEKPLVLETEEDEDEHDALSEEKVDDVDILQPRALMSECDLQVIMELDSEKSFLEFEELTKRAAAALAETESRKSKSEDEFDIVI